MKPVKLFAIGIAVVVFTLFTAAFISRPDRAKDPEPIAPGHGFAVLELFTSEGCSSCPPAEALLARIQKEAGDKPIYLLSYHVDYWNRLGWTDIFSKPEFSKRQQQYSLQLPAEVYTPQLVVNGQSEYIGSDESAVTSAIQAALNDSAKFVLEVQGQLQPGKMILDYQLNGYTGKHAQLLVAIVQKHAVSQVKRGENEGRTLSHVQIVNDLLTFDLQKGNSGKEDILLPSNFNPHDWEFIALVQNAKTGVIEAAQRVTLRPGASRL